MYIYIYTSVCRYMMTMHVCLYVGVYIYIYICIYIHIHIHITCICMICRFKTRLPNSLAFTEQGWSSKYVNTGQTNGKSLMFVLVSLTCWSWTFWVHQQPKLVGQELILTYIQSKVAAFFFCSSNSFLGCDHQVLYFRIMISLQLHIHIS